MRNIKVSEFVYADDILVMAANEEALQENVNVRAKELNKNSMTIVHEKQKSVVSKECRSDNIPIDGKSVERVDDIRYFGSTIERGGNGNK
ncbi:Reverse transcriptase (RNA-dependent DNA polymerase) [Popillia japonica]|uniref:Reverse transcriptase (RNA-dependent DNA polymerase) n=1 Tax=Popillia japonica TaxID=7064 RepID=A0AAW1M4T8_POPJA